MENYALQILFAGSRLANILESDAAHEWMASRALYLQVGGLAVATIGWLWLLVRAFRQNWRWGLGSILLPPVGVLFAGRHLKKGIAPLLLCLSGVIVGALPAVYTLCVKLDLGPRDMLVDGRRHLTLTGWDRKDYSVLRLAPDVVLLQMANPDVTDQTLEALRGMKALEELDLSGTQVTDTGLRILKELPSLARLRLARTHISDQGFHELTSTSDSIMQLDLSGVSVSRETTKAWRDAKPGRRVLQ